MTIHQYNGTHNLTSRNRGAAGIKYLAIHYTAGTTSKSGSAKNTCAWFMNSQCKGSADYIVDDAEMWQYNPSPETRVCWAVGGNASQYNKTTSLSKTMLGVCTNNNSISIEICSTKSGSNYYFTDAVLANAVELAKYLMKKYSIPVERVVMHHHVTGKLCPQMWTANEAALSGWYDFKARLEEKDMTKAETQALIDSAVSKLQTQCDAQAAEIVSLRAEIKRQHSIAGTGDNPSAWAKEYTEAAKEKGLFSGSDGDYGWQCAVTREQLAAVLKDYQ